MCSDVAAPRDETGRVACCQPVAQDGIGPPDAPEPARDTVDALALALWAAAGGGALAAVVAVRRPTYRRAALVVAAVLFLPIGVLGILSVGAVFLAASLVCLVLALLSRPGDAPMAARRC